MKVLRFASCAALALCACQLPVKMTTSSTSRGSSSSGRNGFTSRPTEQPAPPKPQYAYKARTRRGADFMQDTYDRCVAMFDKNYDAWLSADREAKAAIAAAKGKSAYAAVPALLEAYAKVDARTTERQTGAVPPGSELASATRVELATALVEAAVATRAASCVNDQLHANFRSVLPPLTGDRARDKVIVCNGPSDADADTHETARETAAARFDKANQALHDDHTKGEAIDVRILAYSSTPVAATFSLVKLVGHRECVSNGRIGKMPDGSWGPVCDWEERGVTADGKRSELHLGPAGSLPVALQRGDDVAIRFELDPDAPAGADPVPRKGGWWLLGNVSRGKQTLFDQCTLKSGASAKVLFFGDPMRQLR